MPSGSSFAVRQAPSLVCIVLNWNGWPDTIQCLASLANQNYPNLQVVVVDNHSTDDSVAQIQSAFPNVLLLNSPDNGGFAKGNNIGIRYAMAAGADFVWLLNNDTIAPPDTASALIEKAVAAPQAGAVGTVLYFMDSPANIQAWGGGRISLWHGYSSHFTQPATLDDGSFLTGASLLLRTAALQQVGLLDEIFFMYSEDADLCFRLRLAGWQLVVAEHTAVLHKENATSGKKSPRMDRYSAASGVIFLKRYATIPTIAVGLYLASRLGNRIRRREWDRFQAVLQGLRDARQRR